MQIMEVLKRIQIWAKPKFTQNKQRGWFGENMGAARMNSGNWAPLITNEPGPAC